VSNKLFAGIDVSLGNNQLCLMDFEGNPVGKSMSFANNLPGALAMVSHLNSVMEKGNYEKLTIGMEATALYWFPLFNFLNSEPTLQARVLPLNPKVVSNFRNAYADMDKTDVKDSFVIADRLRFGRIPQGYVPDVGFLALQRLTRFRYHLVSCASELKNYAKSFLFLTFSEWNRTGPFSDLFGATSTKLLKKYASAQELAEVSPEELEALLREFSKGHFRNVEAKAALVNQKARDSFPVPKELADQVHLLLRQTLQQLGLLEKHIARLDKKIAKKMRKFSNVLESIPGIGPVLAAGILAEVGDVTRFSGQAKLAKYAGLTWRKNQSGNFNGDVTPLTKTGNVYLRYYLIQAAQCLAQHNDEYREYFHRKLDEVARHPYKRALSLTARKFVRLVFALLSRNQLYMAPEERKRRELAPKGVNQVPEHDSVVQTEVSEVSQKPHKKVKTLAVAARPKNSAWPAGTCAGSKSSQRVGLHLPSL